MTRVAAQLARRGVLDVLAAVAVGYALTIAANALSNVVVDALAQHTDAAAEARAASSPFGVAATSPFFLNFRVGHTVVAYGEALGALVTLSLVSFLALGVLRVRGRELTTCPHCLSSIPRAATVCRYCVLELAGPA